MLTFTRLAELRGKVGTVPIVIAVAALALLVALWIPGAFFDRSSSATAVGQQSGPFVIAHDAPGLALDAAHLAPTPLLIAPQFTFEAFASLALPLFIVTMASQNLPGVAVLKAYGYTPSPSLLIGVTASSMATLAELESPQPDLLAQS